MCCVSRSRSADGRRKCIIAIAATIATTASTSTFTFTPTTSGFDVIAISTALWGGTTLVVVAQTGSGDTADRKAPACSNFILYWCTTSCTSANSTGELANFSMCDVAELRELSF
jgi:hypothetical protein